MTTQAIGGDNRWNRLQSLTESEGDRSDIATLLQYQDGFDAVSPVYLFWELYRPSFLYDDGSRAPASPLSSRSKSVVLELLHELHYRHRIRYEPDQMDSDIRDFLEPGNEYDFRDNELAFPDKLKNLLILIHVAAARAFALKEDSGFSEEVVDCLNDVERAWQWLSLSGYPGSSSGHEVDSYEVFHSIDAVSALALVELGRIQRDRGHYAEALHMMATAEERYQHACVLVMGADDLWPLGGDLSKLSILPRLHEYLTGMHLPVRYVLETFDMLRAERPDVDWSQVAADCRRLAGASFLCFPPGPELLGVEELDKDEDWWEASEEYLIPDEPDWPGGFPAGDYWGIAEEQMDRYTLLDEQSNTVTWFGFWQIAQGWASAQLSPGEFREALREIEEDNAERRLRGYFFGRTWSSLPERARQRLINADLIWNSSQRVSRESILNDLQRAAEEMCYSFIVRPLRNTSEGTDLGLRDYIRMCELPRFEDFAAQCDIKENDIRFLIEDLPSAFRQLLYARNPAEHVAGKIVDVEVVASAYRLYLGIGQPGILPGLARIGHELQNTR